MENAGDVVGVGHNVEDPHAAAALAADGDVDGEDAGEEVGPYERRPRVVVVVVVGYTAFKPAQSLRIRHFDPPYQKNEPNLNQS